MPDFDFSLPALTSLSLRLTTAAPKFLLWVDNTWMQTEIMGVYSGNSCGFSVCVLSPFLMCIPENLEHDNSASIYGKNRVNFWLDLVKITFPYMKNMCKNREWINVLLVVVWVLVLLIRTIRTSPLGFSSNDYSVFCNLYFTHLYQNLSLVVCCYVVMLHLTVFLH